MGVERIEWFLEDQAFSPSYDFAPPQTHPLPSSCCLSFSVFLCVAGRAWGVVADKSYDGEKAWYSINHSILSRCKAWEFQRQKKKHDFLILFSFHESVSIFYEDGWRLVQSRRKFFVFYSRSSTQPKQRSPLLAAAVAGSFPTGKWKDIPPPFHNW